MSDVLEIRGFDELLKALKESPKKVMPYLKKALTLSVRAVQKRVAEYPPASTPMPLIIPHWQPKLPEADDTEQEKKPRRPRLAEKVLRQVRSGRSQPAR
ncbi:MAG: hypothetical protein LC099_06865 [Anaerolineales bacterium]|nr:hypothetical protein [Anaerolineales bacterium]